MNKHFTGHRASYEAAGQSDFIFPQEVAKAMGLKYSNEALEHFLKTLPLREEMGWYKENGFIFIPGPPEIFTMEKIISMEPELFLIGERIKETCYKYQLETKWIILSKKSLMNEIFSHIESDFYNKIPKKDGLKYFEPSPAVLAWAMLVYKKTRNLNIFKGIEIISSAGDGYDSPISRRLPIMFSWNDSDSKIIVYKLGMMSHYIDATVLIDSIPLVALKEDSDDLSF